MTKISKKILISAFAILMALAVIVMPFLYLKKTNKVYADTSSSWTSPNLNLFVTYWSGNNNPSTGTAINVFFSPQFTRSNDTTSLSFFNKYINLSNTSSALQERSYTFALISGTTAINSLNLPTDFANIPILGIDRTTITSYHFYITLVVHHLNY